MSIEQGRAGDGRHSEPVDPAGLPEDLARFLKTKDVACLMHETNHGTVFVVKLPGADIESVQGRVPMHIRHELYEHPSAPVIRTVIRIYDKPENPLAIETFTNVEQDDQRNDFARLADQDTLYLLFYDEELNHRLTKGVGNVEGPTITEIVETAQSLCARISPSQYDFDRAKANVVAHAPL